jgi:hypothetical protein
LNSYKQLLNGAFSNNFAKNKKIKESNNSFTIDLNQERNINYIVLQEDIKNKGQSIKSFNIEIYQNGQ